MIHEPEKRSPSLTREHILQSAARLVLTEGASSLTLDAAAKAAGVSKGGLLYHFPSKEALILGMIDARHQWFKELIEAERMTQVAPQAPGSWHKALVEAGFKSFLACQDITAGMLATVAQDPAAVARIQAGMMELLVIRDKDGISRVVSNTVIATLDGIKMYRVIGLPLPSEEEIQQLRVYLYQLIDQAVAMSASTPHSRESA